MKYLSTATIILFLLSCSTQQSKLDNKVQTEEFHYLMWACKCANWATLDAIEKYKGDSLASQCVFVEPADSSLILSDTLGCTGDIVQFTGQYYVDKGYPKDYIKDEQQVDKAKVFKYTSFKIIKSNYSKNLAEQIDSGKYMVDKGALNGQTKTIDVSYAAIMCTCPQWFETKYENDTSNFERFYLEPANKKIVAANKLYDGTNIPLRISVTGHFYSKKGYPANYFPTKGDPKPAKVFRYDKLKIIQNGKRVTQKTACNIS